MRLTFNILLLSYLLRQRSMILQLIMHDCVMSYNLTWCCWFYFLWFTYQDNFTDGNVCWYIENPINRFVAGKHQYSRSVWLAAAEDIDISITSWWRTCVPIPLVHRQYMDFVLCRTAARHTAVDCPGLLIVKLWFGEGCNTILDDFTTLCIS